MAGALRVLTSAKPTSASASPCPYSRIPSPSGSTHETLPNTVWPARVLVLSTRTSPATRGASRSSGRKLVVRSKKRPSNAGGSSTCAGAFCVAASRCRRTGRASAFDERAMASGALVVCAETRKLLRVEEAMEEREIFERRELWEVSVQSADRGVGVLTRWQSSGILPSAGPGGHCELARTPQWRRWSWTAPRAGSC